MVVLKKVSLFFFIKYSWELIMGLVAIALLTWLVNRFIEIEEVTSLLPSIAVFGTVMSLLLAFKTNESYNRWWEARILWGSMLNYIRSFSRQVINLIRLNIGTSIKTEEELTALHQELIYRHLAYINSVRLSLRKQTNWDELKSFLNREELTQVTGKASISTQINPASGTTPKLNISRQQQRFSLYAIGQYSE